MSLDHQKKDSALKSLVTTEKNGLHLFMLLKSFSKLDKNELNSSSFWLGEQ